MNISKNHSPYLVKICEALAEVLSEASQATPDRVAGYAANFDFWIDEAEHRMKLLKGYEERFRRFQEVQSAFASEHSIRWNERSGWTPPPKDVKRSLSTGQRKELRRKIISAATKFIDRCAKIERISESEKLESIRRINGIFKEK